MKKILCAAILLATLSCKKKNDDEAINTNTPTAEQLAGTYKQTSQKINGVEMFNTSSGAYEACDLDDTYTLSTNGTATRNDVGTVCTPDNNDQTTWSVSGSTFMLDTETLNIVNYNGSTLQLSASETLSGVTYTTEITFVKQ
ncbi:MAG: hypothetical protein EOP50_07070 [Sphingobacteriales bacterium]|nr:MAG: hypothetical protein EOP50_07070 [Sphingobacteriales bacterium]